LAVGSCRPSPLQLQLSQAPQTSQERHIGIFSYIVISLSLSPSYLLISAGFPYIGAPQRFFSTPLSSWSLDSDHGFTQPSSHHHDPPSHHHQSHHILRNLPPILRPSIIVLLSPSSHAGHQCHPVCTSISTMNWSLDCNTTSFRVTFYATSSDLHTYKASSFFIPRLYDNGCSFASRY